MFVGWLALHMGMDEDRGPTYAIEGIIVVIVVAVCIGFDLFERESRNRVYDEIMAAIAAIEEFGEDGELLTKMAHRADMAALSHFRRTGGTSIPWSESDKVFYLGAFFDAIYYEAHHHHRKDLKDALRGVEHTLGRRYKIPHIGRWPG